MAGGAGFRSLLSWALLETFNGISSTARVVGDAWPDAPAFVEARQPLLAA